MLERVRDPSAWAALRNLFGEYVASLGFPLTFQDVERELAEIETEYGPPHGRAWLAKPDGPTAGSIAGGVGLRRFDEDSGEIKRMYVRPAYRGTGLGAQLAQACVDAAREIGYRRVLLDTIASMESALRIYRSLGFVQTGPYRYNPLPDAIYMELVL